MFQTNYETKSILPEGEYECIIAGAYLAATRGGTEYFSVRFVIRNDVAQKYQNKNIFHAIWRRKPEKRTKDDDQVDGFSFKQIMNLAEAAGLPKGKSYHDLNELGADMKGKCVLVTIEHDEYNGETQEKVKWTNRTRYPECHHVMKTKKDIQTPQPDPEASIDITADDDLPF